MKVVGLTGDDCDDENDVAARPGGCDRGTMGGCGSDRCSGQSISKERGRVNRKEEEASSKEHDERRNNGAPPRRQRQRRLPCLRDHTNPPRSNTLTMTIEPVNEIEINGVKHPCPSSTSKYTDCYLLFFAFLSHLAKNSPVVFHQV